jgi:hypothetical protein
MHTRARSPVHPQTRAHAHAHTRVQAAEHQKSARRKMAIIAAVVVLGLFRLAQWRVATRARPALSPSLTRADDFVRELAIGRGLARPATFLALALVARAGFALRPTIDVLGSVIGIVAWCYAVVLWWHNRRLGLDYLRDELRQPILS